MCVLSTGRLFWPQVLLNFEFPWILREDDIMHDPDEVEDDHDTCEASVIRLMSIPTGPKNNERIVKLRATCRTCPGAVLVAGRGRSGARRTSPSTVATMAVDCGYFEGKKTHGEQESGPSPIVVSRFSGTRVTTAHVPAPRVQPILGVFKCWCERLQQQEPQRSSCAQTASLRSPTCSDRRLPHAA